MRLNLTFAVGKKKYGETKTYTYFMLQYTLFIIQEHVTGINFAQNSKNLQIEKKRSYTHYGPRKKGKTSELSKHWQEMK